MYALDRQQLAAVAGGKGPSTGEALTLASGVGGGIGASYVLAGAGGTLAGVASSLGSTAAMTVTTAGATGLAAAGLAGWYAGESIYGMMPSSLQDAIGGTVASALDMLSSAAGSLWSSLVSGMTVRSASK